MGEILKLSNSKVTTWRKCHMAYHYKYNLKLRPKRKGIALRRGSIIHECIEAYDSGRSWRKPYKEFAKQFYPLTMDAVDCDSGWTWGEAPLPWEGGCR